MQYTICSFNYSWQYSNLRLELIWEINLEMAKKNAITSGNYFSKHKHTHSIKGIIFLSFLYILSESTSYLCLVWTAFQQSLNPMI